MLIKSKYGVSGLIKGWDDQWLLAYGKLQTLVAAVYVAFVS